MIRVEPQPVLRAEEHHGKNPVRSIRLTMDLAPYLAHADIVFTGYAYGHIRSSAPARERAVRLAVFEGERARLDKTLTVQGLADVKRLPMTYERTFGGIGFADNPFGCGAGSDTDVPSIFDPAQPQRPVGFAPFGRAFPPRKRLLGTTARTLLDGNVAEIPDDFDWAYYQAAPPDQRTEHLSGSEWIMLEGLHPTESCLRTRLPDARGFARVHGLARFGVAEGQILELIADTLRIDGNEQRCTVVWRRSFPIQEEALESLRIVAGVEAAGAALLWSEVRAPEAERRSPRVVPPPRSNKSEHISTMILTDEPEERAPQKDHPFAGTMVTAHNPEIAAARAAVLPFQQGVSSLAQPSPRRTPSPQDLFSQTLAEPPDEAPAAQRSVLPFAPKPAIAPPITAVMAPLPIAAAPAPAPAPPPAKPVTPKAAEELWAPPPPAAPTPRPAPAAPTMPMVSPSLKKGLYGRFGR